MQHSTLLAEIDEMIARLESLVSSQARMPRGPENSVASRVLRARQSRLAWLKRVRAGMLANRAQDTVLH